LPDCNFNIYQHIGFANRVFESCGVEFRIGVSESNVGPRLAHAWLGGDNTMDYAISCGTLHADKIRVLSGATRHFNPSGRVLVFYVPNIRPSVPGFSEFPSCAGMNINMAVLNRGAPGRTFAHEMGHILLNSSRHRGIVNPSDMNNLMIPSDRATGERLDTPQCRTIRTNV
jgi:hypothetical protein